MRKTTEPTETEQHGAGTPGTDALIIGEALLDVVHRVDGSLHRFPGGSPANVALTLGRLGRPVRLMTHIGNDTAGTTIQDWLDESGVELTPNSIHHGYTSTATAHLDIEGAATYTFDIDWDLSPGGEDSGHRPLAVHTGSIAAVLQPGAATVRNLLLAARRTATITYDPNIRPALMGTPDDVRTEIEEIVSMADVVKVSDEDLEWLYPGIDPETFARQWLELGPALIVLTRGGAGATAVTRDTALHVDAPPVSVVDTVGAGDSFMGALLDQLWSAGLLGADRRHQLQQIPPAVLRHALQRCTEVAAITVSRAGANPPTRSELSRNYA